MELTKTRTAGLLVLIVIGVAALLAGPGILAYFSSTVTQTDSNLFTAGTIELKVDGNNPWTGVFNTSLTDLKPAMKGWGNVSLENTGTNPFNVWMKISDVTTDGGILTIPEHQEDPTDAVNDIDTVMRYDLYVNGAANITDAADYFISTPGHTLTGTAVKDKWIYLGNYDAGATVPVHQSFMMDKDTTNWAQGDTMTFKVTFYALQSEGDPVAPGPTTTLVLP
ncbi:MAG: TasA family protein [Methanospirillum sp.]